MDDKKQTYFTYIVTVKSASVRGQMTPQGSPSIGFSERTSAVLVVGAGVVKPGQSCCTGCCGNTLLIVHTFATICSANSANCRKELAWYTFSIPEPLAIAISSCVSANFPTPIAMRYFGNTISVGQICFKAVLIY